MNKNIPVITFYEGHSDLINWLHARNYHPLVSLKGTGLDPLSKMDTQRYFSVSNSGVKMIVEGVYKNIDFSICFNDGVEGVDWEVVESWVNKMVAGYDLNDLEMTVMGVPESMSVGTDCEDFVTVGGVQKDASEEYGFRMKELNELDIMVYEVMKPNTDKPYVTVTRDYRSKGHEDFFSSLFVCTTWAVDRADIMFLEKVWEWLAMEGKCNLEKLVTLRIRRCEGGEIEPEVYRNDLESVLQLLKDRTVVCGHKRKGVERVDGAKRVT